ncbi:MAG: rod shape-determining protein MreC [Ignavibacteriales bacterium]|nr:rod shape-determining protein MreC [Ignavibacteriales bacterium]
MFQRIYNFILIFREYVVLSGLLLVSLTLLAFNDNTQMRHIRGITTVAFGLVQERLAIVPRYIGLRSENEQLRETIVDLADEVSQLREARLENIRLRRLLGLHESSSYPLIAGRVVGKNLTLLRNTITLNVGSRDSIREQMPVVGDGGLVGVVSHVADRYSIVRILLNTDFRASAKVQRSRVDGILAWDGRSLLLNNVAKTLDVKVGDVVITSEYSGTYPPNIRIGVVNEVREQEGTLFKKVFVFPGVDFVKLEEVFVMTYAPDRERLALEQSTTRQPRR